MHTSLSPPSNSPPLFNYSSPPTTLTVPNNPRSVHLRTPKNPNFKSPKSNLKTPISPTTHNNPNPNSLLSWSSPTAGKLRSLASEFRSMPESVDRVRRLLNYAAVLGQFGNPGRVESNRVRGCTTQVWVEARLDDSDGLMRFKADSDSEITKGFCSCLIWVFDMAAPEEVMAVTGDDLVDMNVGYSGGRARSRVNTWHNVLMSMQKKTRDLVEERRKVEIVDDIMGELTTIHRKDFGVLE